MSDDNEDSPPHIPMPETLAPRPTPTPTGWGLRRMMGFSSRNPVDYSASSADDDVEEEDDNSNGNEERVEPTELFTGGEDEEEDEDNNSNGDEESVEPTELEDDGSVEPTELEDDGILEFDWREMGPLSFQEKKEAQILNFLTAVRARQNDQINRQNNQIIRQNDQIIRQNDQIIGQGNQMRANAEVENAILDEMCTGTPAAAVSNRRRTIGGQAIVTPRRAMATKEQFRAQSARKAQRNMVREEVRSLHRGYSRAASVPDLDAETELELADEDHIPNPQSAARVRFKFERQLSDSRMHDMTYRPHPSEVRQQVKQSCPEVHQAVLKKEAMSRRRSTARLKDPPPVATHKEEEEEEEDTKPAAVPRLSSNDPLPQAVKIIPGRSESKEEKNFRLAQMYGKRVGASDYIANESDRILAKNRIVEKHNTLYCKRQEARQQANHDDTEKAVALALYEEDLVEELRRYVKDLKKDAQFAEKKAAFERVKTACFPNGKKDNGHALKTYVENLPAEVEKKAEKAKIRMEKVAGILRVFDSVGGLEERLAASPSAPTRNQYAIFIMYTHGDGKTLPTAKEKGGAFSSKKNCANVLKGWLAIKDNQTKKA